VQALLVEHVQERVFMLVLVLQDLTCFRDLAGHRLIENLSGTLVPFHELECKGQSE